MGYPKREKDSTYYRQKHTDFKNKIKNMISLLYNYMRFILFYTIMIQLIIIICNNNNSFNKVVFVNVITEVHGYIMYNSNHYYFFHNKRRFIIKKNNYHDNSM